MRAATVLVLLGALTLSGCVATAPTVREPDRLRTPFVASEHEAFAREGTSTLRAQAFLRQRGGGIVTCAGSSALLMPYSEFFLELTWYLKERRRVEHDPAAKPMLAQITRRTQCDAQGNFSFDKLPAGKYIAVADVVWDVAGRFQGGAVMTVVTLGEGSSVSIIMSDPTPLR